MLTGSAVSATSQTKGGEEECTYTLVLTAIVIVGTEEYPIFSLEKVCVRVIDEAS